VQGEKSIPEAGPFRRYSANLCKTGEVTPVEMFKTFNCGIGMIAIVDEDDVEDICHQLNRKWGRNPVCHRGSGRR